MTCGHGDEECWCYLWQIAKAVIARGNEWAAFVVKR